MVGPLGSACQAKWGWLEKQKIAMIKMAQASGIQLVPPSERDAHARQLSTFGTGQFILDAFRHGRSLTVGGKARSMMAAVTGLLSAFGAVFYLDANQNVLPWRLSAPTPFKIDLTHFDSRIQHTVFTGCRCNQSTLGLQTAHHIFFGPQKVAFLLLGYSYRCSLFIFADVTAIVLLFRQTR